MISESDAVKEIILLESLSTLTDHEIKVILSVLTWDEMIELVGVVSQLEVGD